MRTIEVEMAAIQEPTFKTPQAAIHWAKERDRAHYDPAVAEYFGKVITGVKWCDTALLFQTGDDSGLRIDCHALGLGVSVVARADSEDVGNSDEAIEIHFPSEVYSWNRDEIARKLIGNTLTSISGSPAWLFIDIASFGILAVDMVIERHSKMPIFDVGAQ
jgi:hypothetical protein